MPKIGLNTVSPYLRVRRYKCFRLDHIQWFRLCHWSHCVCVSASGLAWISDTPLTFWFSAAVGLQSSYNPEEQCLSQWLSELTLTGLSLTCHAAAYHSAQETRMTGPGRRLHSWSGHRSTVNGVEWGSCGSLKRKSRYSYLKKGELMLKGQNQQVLTIVFKWTFT